MENFDTYLCKTAFRIGLTQHLNDSLLQHFSDENCKEKLVLTDCNLNQNRGISIYHFMVPMSMFKKWISSFTVDIGAKETILAALKGVKRSTESWKINLSEVQLRDESIFFQVETKSLVEVLMQYFVGQNDIFLKDCNSIDISAENSQKKVVLCYLNDTSAVRTLLLASLLFDKTCVFFGISKNPLETDIDLLLRRLKLEFPFEYPLSISGNTMAVFAKSQYFRTETEDGVSENFILFEEKCMEQFTNNHSWYKCILNTKLFLTTLTLSSISDMEIVLLSFHAQGGIGNAKIYHIGINDDMLYAKQLCIAFLIYVDHTNKAMSPTAKQLFSNENHIFHAPINTAFKAQELLGRYKQRLAASFASRGVQSESLVSSVDDMAPSVLKLDILSVSISSSVKHHLDSGSSSFANFVMYNYCRLSNLLKIYTDKVESGFYPSLPELENIDFSLLQEKSEQLLIDQIWKFGDVKLLISDVFRESFKLKSFKPHLAVIYVQQLCSVFSKFYNRFHVLGPNYVHMLPLMHARIYLLKAVKSILTIVFSFLKIIPLEYM